MVSVGKYRQNDEVDGQWVSLWFEDISIEDDTIQSVEYMICKTYQNDEDEIVSFAANVNEAYWKIFNKWGSYLTFELL